MPWQELVIEGEDDDFESFLAQAADIAVLRGRDLELEPLSLFDRLCGLLDLPHHHLVFAAPEGAEELVRRIVDHSKLALKRRVAVERAGFPFEAKAFSEGTAERIKSVIHAPLPDAVALVGLTEKEIHDPRAVAVELYSPVHSYEYRATGRVEGDLGGVAEVQRRMRDIDFLDPAKIEVTVRDLPARLPLSASRP
jgi:hypothetical protein